MQTASDGLIPWRYDIPIPGFIRTHVNRCETDSASLLSPCTRSQLPYRSIDDTVFIGEDVYLHNAVERILSKSSSSNSVQMFSLVSHSWRSSSASFQPDSGTSAGSALFNSSKYCETSPSTQGRADTLQFFTITHIA